MRYQEAEAPAQDVDCIFGTGVKPAKRTSWRVDDCERLLERQQRSGFSTAPGWLKRTGNQRVSFAIAGPFPACGLPFPGLAPVPPHCCLNGAAASFSSLHSRSRVPMPVRPLTALLMSRPYRALRSTGYISMVREITTRLVTCKRGSSIGGPRYWGGACPGRHKNAFRGSGQTSQKHVRDPGHLLSTKPCIDAISHNLLPIPRLRILQAIGKVVSGPKSPD